MTKAPLPTSTRRRRRWRRIVAGTVMAGSLALTTACGVAVADPSSQSWGSSSSTGSGTTLGQGSATSSHAVSQGS